MAKVQGLKVARSKDWAKRSLGAAEKTGFLKVGTARRPYPYNKVGSPTGSGIDRGCKLFKNAFCRDLDGVVGHGNHGFAFSGC